VIKAVAEALVGDRDRARKAPGDWPVLIGPRSTKWGSPLQEAEPSRWSRPLRSAACTLPPAFTLVTFPAGARY
jgi:hypothetical protein